MYSPPFTNKIRTSTLHEWLNNKSIYTQAKIKFYTNNIENNTNKPKIIWDIINDTKNKKHNTQSTLSSEEFNKFFVNIPNIISANLQKSGADPTHTTSKTIHNNHTLFLAPESPEEVKIILRSLSDSTAKDIFGLSNKILKQLSEGLALPLSIIINKCFTSGSFPSRLKTSRVIPIFKKGDENDPSNYRPISLVPVLSKPIEISLNNRLTAFLERSSLLSMHQFGFRKKRSTADALRALVGLMVERFEKGESVLAVFCDLSKAFDCVSHQTLLNKLVYYGIRGNSLQIIKSYLSERFQLVDLDGVRSEALPVSAGVPQGSILGPLLFILYVNELPSQFPDLTSVQYADDTTLLDHNHNTPHLQSVAASTIKKLHTWFADSNLCLNLEKTETGLFSLKEKDEGKYFKFLGVLLDSKLTWKHHITQLTKSLSSILFLLRRIAHTTPIEVSRTAYMGLFQSKLSYGLILWGNSTDWQKVFVIQKKAIRIISKLKPSDTCRISFRDLRILTLPGLYIFQCLTYIKATITEFTTVSSRHNYITRHGENILTQQHRLSLTHKSYIINSIKLYNSLSADLKSLPYILFKRKIKNLLLEVCPYTLDEFYASNS